MGGVSGRPQRGRPVSLGQDGAGVLTIEWSDGHRGRVPVRTLRLACPCAECVDEWTGEGRLDEESVPEDIQPVNIEPVGNYALTIAWSDGHGTGIYTYEKLAELCHCDECMTREVAE